MPLRPPEVRKAAETLRKWRKDQRTARPKPEPTAKDQRHTRQHDGGFLAFLRRQRCCVGPAGCFGAVQAAHIRFSKPGTPNPGLGRKSDDRRAVPLCRGHHLDAPDAQHRGDERTWWAGRGLDPDELAAGYFRRYEAGE